ncbi:MAG TPA: glycosyltransferase family 4 protein [Gammaproteobacteria bacterium]
MHVLQISFFVDRERRRPEALLEAWHSLADVAAAAASAGLGVTVVQASLVPAVIFRGGVEFLFLAPEAPGVPLAGGATFHGLLRSRAADVLHVHGLDFADDVLALRAAAPDVPILLQDHADRPPRLWRRPRWRRGAAAADGVSFCARAQAAPFARAGLLPPHAQIFEIPESTSTFRPGDRAAARAATGVHGDPAVLWVGHLDRNKDPLTVLDGVAAAARELPGLRLWCCFGSAPLLGDVQARIAGDARLRGRVHLLGRVPHAAVETLMRAADLFVLGSRREGSSFALIEALATGLTPVVTDIPPLRALTGGGAVGALWPCGDSPALARALVGAAATAAAPAARAAVRTHFDAELSSGALGRKLAAAYSALVQAKRMAAAAPGAAAAAGQPP